LAALDLVKTALTPIAGLGVIEAIGAPYSAARSVHAIEQVMIKTERGMRQRRIGPSRGQRGRP
jgi:hypothetical protein